MLSVVTKDDLNPSLHFFNQIWHKLRCSWYLIKKTKQNKKLAFAKLDCRAVSKVKWWEKKVRVSGVFAEYTSVCFLHECLLHWSLFCRNARGGMVVLCLGPRLPCLHHSLRGSGQRCQAWAEILGAECSTATGPWGKHLGSVDCRCRSDVETWKMH